jgi:cholesterol transport system auxiliary component
MKPLSVLGRGAAILLAAAALAGCVSLFPKQAPAQLYRFGAAPAPAAASQAGPRFAFVSAPIEFDRAASGDRMLTTTGEEAAYIKGARWEDSASDLFESAVEDAFRADDGAARLVARGEVGHIDYALRLEVREFDVRYEGGPGSPVVVVRLHADLSQLDGMRLAGDRLFEARAPASGNRVTAIAAAYNQAVAKVVGDLVAWVDAKGAA